MLLLHYFPLLDKTYNNQNQEGFIMCQRQSLEAFRKKKCSLKFRKFHRKTPVLWSLCNNVAAL